MAQKQKTEPFDATTVRLQDSNLIEASAGTGKTYSIAILTLRLLLEKNMLIQEILMVTFTKAAVAELEMRIRSFIRMAYVKSCGGTIEDATISSIVEKAQAMIGPDEIESRLKSAIIFLDETSILTIHSFCQRTLSEFAFETQQIMGAESMSEEALTDISTHAINHFWRTHITGLDYALLQFLMPHKLSKSTLEKIIQNALSGKTYFITEPCEADLFSPQRQAAYATKFSDYKERIRILKDQLVPYIIEHKTELIERVAKGGKTGQKQFPPELFETPELVLEIIITKAEREFIIKLFPDILAMLTEIDNVELELNKQIYLFINKIHQFAIGEITTTINRNKEDKSLMSFDDMILKLHRAVVVKPNLQLIAALRKKYKSVFIDEFQDTDKLQYELFQTLYGKETILFYIGDPKQSIYGWRKADIFTYFKASKEVQHRYGMNTNYRSSKSVIAAQNEFFLPLPDFDTFHFGDAPDRILYNPVEAPQDREPGHLLYRGKPVCPMSILGHNNKEEINESVAAIIAVLLENEDYAITEKESTRKIRPSDIGILVRSNVRGKELKKTLSAYKIPAVTIDESKLLSSDESKELLYVLEAVHDIHSGSIRKALLTKMGGFTIEDLYQLNEEEVLNRFKIYQETWLKEGVYVMLMKFFTDYRIKSRFLDPEVPNGERFLANLLQLQELLHKIQVRKQFAPIELINWLQKSIEGHSAEGDEYQQRIESDEEAVKIVTIHKSKGLEYKIVLAPELDMKEGRQELKSFREETSGEYVFAEQALLEPEQEQMIATQFEQENRRLMYVAITRAKYKCYVISNDHLKNTGLKTFLHALRNTNPSNIAFEMAPAIPDNYRYNQTATTFPIVYRKAESFSLTQINWRKISYSALNPDHGSSIKFLNGKPVTPYDLFVFETLRRGASTGNLLHYIFEHIDFTDSSFRERIIANALKRLAPGLEETYASHLETLIDHCTAVKLLCEQEAFTLNEIKNEQRLNELEFDFKVSLFHTNQIEQLSTPDTPFQVKSSRQLEGIMNGKMDLFFEHNGRYYILDWKSNFLGNQTEDYSAEGIAASMNENNYHLQYHIYTVAVCKYLRLRLPDFNYETHFGGVFYLFLRGIRKEQSTGIFFKKPDRKIIRQLSEIVAAPTKAE